VIERATGLHRRPRGIGNKAAQPWRRGVAAVVSAADAAESSPDDGSGWFIRVLRRAARGARTDAQEPRPGSSDVSAVCADHVVPASADFRYRLTHSGGRARIGRLGDANCSAAVCGLADEPAQSHATRLNRTTAHAAPGGSSAASPRNGIGRAAGSRLDSLIRGRLREARAPARAPATALLAESGGCRLCAPARRPRSK
jgi:hypothetical protein